MKKNDILRITYAAMLIAISIVLTRMFSMPISIAGIQAIRLNLGFIPIMLAALLLGPMYGGIVGAAADIVGYFLNPMGGAYFPGFTLTSTLVGIIPYIICIKNKRNLYLITAAVFITTITASLLNTVWLVIFFNRSFSVLIIPRIISALIMCPVYTFFVYTLNNLVSRTLKRV